MKESQRTTERLNIYIPQSLRDSIVRLGMKKNIMLGWCDDGHTSPGGQWHLGCHQCGQCHVVPAVYVVHGHIWVGVGCCT